MNVYERHLYQRFYDELHWGDIGMLRLMRGISELEVEHHSRRDAWAKVQQRRTEALGGSVESPWQRYGPEPAPALEPTDLTVCMARSTPWIWKPHILGDDGRCVHCGESKEG